MICHYLASCGLKENDHSLTDETTAAVVSVLLSHIWDGYIYFEVCVTAMGKIHEYTRCMRNPETHTRLDNIITSPACMVGQRTNEVTLKQRLG